VGIGSYELMIHREGRRGAERRSDFIVLHIPPHPPRWMSPITDGL